MNAALAYQKTQDLKDAKFGFDAFDDKQQDANKIVACDMSFIECFDLLNKQLEDLRHAKTRDELKARQTLLLAKQNLIKNFKSA